MRYSGRQGRTNGYFQERVAQQRAGVVVTRPSAQSDKAQEARTRDPGGQTGFRKEQCSPNCVKASQDIREATSRLKRKLMADSSPGLLPEVGGFTREARE